MRARINPSVRLRADKFGGVCYVPHRDDFFAADKRVFEFISKHNAEWIDIAAEEHEGVISLARLGILQTEPLTQEASYSGPGFLGEFKDLPTVSEALVVNCFCTSHCPLKCVYCHADDLMQVFRAEETQLDLENVASTAQQMRAMVAVITGGDPLSRPERAAFLIEKLSATKALVLDTSGVGDIRPMLGILKKHDVHVRVSLDAVSSINDKLRPINKDYIQSKTTSRISAERTIKLCLESSIPVTVQSVICSSTENESELLDLRDSLIDWGVRHWVLHLTVKGGNARRIEAEADRHTRKRGILPSKNVHSLLASLIQNTEKLSPGLDIRCTDTDNTPNSVLLIGSTGNLYTEGLAHHGKVELYSARDGQSDELRSLWHYVDKFGHARRYLNWTEWLAGGRNLSDISYPVKLPRQTPAESAAVENEAKFAVQNAEYLRGRLAQLGFNSLPVSFQRDEYFDTQEERLTEMDYVVRIRDEGGKAEVGLKGPRSYTENGYSRIEIEVPVTSVEEARESLSSKNYRRTWFFEKKRTEFTSPNWDLVVVLDEIPKAGFFVEFEGESTLIAKLRQELGDAISEPERRNYADIFRDYKEAEGVNRENVHGAEFL